MLVMEVGCTEAAVRTGLPLNTVLSWSARGNWLKPAAQKLPPTVRPTIRAIIAPAEALAQCIAEDGRATRAAGMRYARRTVEHAANLSEVAPGEALEQSQNVKASLQSAAIAGGWADATQGHATVINIALLGLPGAGDAPATVDI